MGNEAWINDYIAKSTSDFADKHAADNNIPDWLDTYNPPEEAPKPAEENPLQTVGNIAVDTGKALLRGAVKAGDAIAGLAQNTLSDSAIIGDAAMGNMDSSRISPAQAAIDYGLGTARDYTTRAIANKAAKELPYSPATLAASDRQQADKDERLKQIDIDTPKIKSDGLIQDWNANNAWRTAKQVGAGIASGVSEPRSIIPSLVESLPEFLAIAAGSKGIGLARGIGGLGDANALAKAAKLANAGDSVTSDIMAKHLAKVDSLATKLEDAKLTGDAALEAKYGKKINDANAWTAKKELANNAEKAAERQDLAIAGLGNFVLEGQGASDSAQQQFDKLPDKKLRENPQFVELENKYGFEQAKKIAS